MAVNIIIVCLLSIVPIYQFIRLDSLIFQLSTDIENGKLITSKIKKISVITSLYNTAHL